MNSSDDISEIIKVSKNNLDRIADAFNGLGTIFLKNVSTPEKMYNDQNCRETEQLLNEIEDACHKLHYQPFVPKGYEKSNKFLLQAEEEYMAYVELSRKALKAKSTDLQLEAEPHSIAAVKLETASLKAIPR